MYKKKNIYKYLVLISIISLEFSIGFLAIRWAFARLTQKQNLEKVNLVKINSKSIEVSENTLFFELKSNIIQEDTSDWLSEKVSYTHNNDGLNDLHTYSIEKPDDIFRIIALGDSFTYGLFVNTKDSYPEVLEKKFVSNSLCKNKKTEVLNFGVPGYDIHLAIQRLQTRGLKYNPDIVIWYLKEDDFEQIYELMVEHVDKIKKSLEESGELERLAKEGIINPQWQMASEELNKEIGIDELLKREKKSLFNFPNDYKNPLFIIMPDNLNQKFVNLIVEFKNYRSNTFIGNIPSSSFSKFPDSHFDKKGNRQLADAIYSYLLNSDPCNIHL